MRRGKGKCGNQEPGLHLAPKCEHQSSVPEPIWMPGGPTIIPAPGGADGILRARFPARLTIQEDLSFLVRACLGARSREHDPQLQFWTSTFKCTCTHACAHTQVHHTYEKHAYTHMCTSHTDIHHKKNWKKKKVKLLLSSLITSGSKHPNSS